MGLGEAVSEQHTMSRIYRWLRLTLVLSFLLIALGGTVRVTQSGLSCPDWPFCFGKLFPQFNFQIFMEWFHRAVAGVVTILFTVISIGILRVESLRRHFRAPLIIGAGILAIQVVLGGLTVLMLLSPKIVAAHLTNGLLFFGLILFMTVKARIGGGKPSPRNGLTPRLIFAIALLPMMVLTQIYLGGMVSSSHAGLACPDFPTCRGSFWPQDAGFQVLLQMTHRYLAFVVLAYGFLVRYVSQRYFVPMKISLLLRAIPSLVLMQITLGLLNIMMKLPLWASVAHLGLAVLVFAKAKGTIIILSLAFANNPRLGLLYTPYL